MRARCGLENPRTAFRANTRRVLLGVATRHNQASASLVAGAKQAMRTPGVGMPHGECVGNAESANSSRPDGPRDTTRHLQIKPRRGGQDQLLSQAARQTHDANQQCLVTAFPERLDGINYKKKPRQAAVASEDSAPGGPRLERGACATPARRPPARSAARAHAFEFLRRPAT